MALRKLDDQSPNSYQALANQLRPGETLVITYRGRQTDIRSQDDIKTKVAPMLADRSVSTREVYFQAKS